MLYLLAIANIAAMNILVFDFFWVGGGLFRAASTARGRIGAIAASLHHSHRNMESEPCL